MYNWSNIQMYNCYMYLRCTNIQIPRYWNCVLWKLIELHKVSKQFMVKVGQTWTVMATELLNQQKEHCDNRLHLIIDWHWACFGTHTGTFWRSQLQCSLADWNNLYFTCNGGTIFCCASHTRWYPFSIGFLLLFCLYILEMFITN